MSTPSLPTISPDCLTVINDQVTTTSLDVAKLFRKRHDNVLRAIDLLSKDIPEDFALLIFEEGYYTTPETGDQQHRIYRMTRDGFTLLAMGFTGQRAMQFKIAYTLLHQHLMQTLTINEIKRRAQEADGNSPEPDDKPRQVGDGTEQS